jgi:hypothetical protein
MPGERPWDEAYGPPNPVEVAVELSAITLTSRVTVESGGFLSLFGAGGAFYELELPPNALLTDVDVTMTEVASLGGAPLGDALVGAVLLEPSGLMFVEPATLTITPAMPIPITAEGPFSAGSDGTDFHLYPLDPDPSAVRMDIYHFSLYGLFQAEAGARAAAAAFTPTAVELQLEAELSKVTQQARETGGTVDAERIKALFDDYRARVLRPLLGQAQASPDVFVEATQKWMAYARLRDRLDQRWDLQDVELLRLWEEGFRTFLKRQVERCQHEHDIGSIVDVLKVRRLAEILRVPSAIVAYDGGENAQLERCATFTLEMLSSTTNRVTTCIIGAGMIEEDANVFATVEIRPLQGLGGSTSFGLEDAGGPWVGPMEWGAASARARCQFLSADVAECTMTMAGYGPAGDFTVLSIDWQLNLTRHADAAAATPARLAIGGMVVQPGDPELLYDTDCEGGWAVWGGGGSDTGLGSASWRAIWREMTPQMRCREFAAGPDVRWSEYEAPEASVAYYLDCWDFKLHGDVIATWEQEASTRTLGSASEKTTFTLRHTPRP